MIKDDKSRFSILASGFLLYIALLIVANMITTQYIARSFNYQLALGKPIIGHLYSPHMWIVWAIKYGDIYREFFKKVFWLFGFSILFSTFFYVFFKIFAARKMKMYDNVHGSAHFATKNEIEKMGLLNQQMGVYIGAWQDPKTNTIKYLKHNGPEHILAFAPTRSGKGVGLVIPTLLAWKGSCVVLDIKGENWELTSGYRKEQGQKVLRFDPTSESSVKFNPLEEVRLDLKYIVGDIQNISSLIVDPDGKGLEDHWSKTAFAFLNAIILHLVLKGQQKNEIPTMSMIRETIANIDKIDNSIKETLKEIIEYPYENETLGNIVRVGAKEAMSKPENELGSVVSTAVSNLSLFDDPVVANNISKSDFKIKDLMRNSEKAPISLYLVIKPSDMLRLKPLIRLFLNQLLTLLIGDMKFKNGQQVIEYDHRLLLMLDEFTSLGKLPLFETALAYMAGYGIKSYIIVQDLTQLYKAYSKEEAIISNCHIRIAYAPNKVETAELLSKMTGQTTVVKTVRSMSGGRSNFFLKNVTESYQEVQRPLLTIDECMQLPGAQKDSAGKVTKPGDMLIFIAGNPTIYGKQILYFIDPVLAKRSKIKPPETSDSLLYH